MATYRSKFSISFLAICWRVTVFHFRIQELAFINPYSSDFASLPATITASSGSTICLCRGTHRFAEYDERSELSESPKDWFCESKFLFQFFFINFNHDHSWLRLSALKKWRKCSAISSNRVLRRLKSNKKLKVISSSSVGSLPSLFLESMYPSTHGTSGLGFYHSVLVCWCSPSIIFLLN